VDTILPESINYHVWFELLPPASFGLPEGSRTVVPPGEIYSPTLLTSSMTKVSHGTLSRYRSDEEAIRESITLGKINGHLEDNFLLLVVEAEDHRVATELARDAADRFAKHLTLGVGRSLSATLIAVEDQDGQRCPMLHRKELFSITTYGLDELRAEVRRAQSASAISDNQLDRALDYFDHATFLIGNADEFASRGGPRHYDFFASAIFLNLWKAVTVIIGDSTESDFQSRYKKFGFTYEFFSDEIGRLKTLRDSYDVAHHHISRDRVDEVKENFGEAAQISRQVITRYRDFVDPVVSPDTDNQDVS
jgi:hypothetical protein